MSTIYFLAPNARWQGRNLVGDAAIDGTLKTYIAGTLTPKLTYADPEGITPNPVEIPLDDKGEANVYWAYDPDEPVLYYIELYDKDGALVYSQDDYPTVSTTNAAPAIPSDILNFVRNPQFTYWTNTTSYPAILQSGSANDFVADEWLFFRSNTTATVNISQQIFTLGQSIVPSNPIAYLHYECGTAVGAGETYKRFRQDYKSVQTLSGQTVSFAFLAKSDLSSTISVNLIQNFGTGGSPSSDVTTNLLTANLTSAWQYFSISKAIPIASGTLGSNGDDRTSLSIDVPLNTIASQLDMCNVQLQPTTSITPFVTASQENGYLQLKKLIEASLFKTGDVKFSLRPVTPLDPGWIVANTTNTIGNPASGSTYTGISTYALFKMIWEGVTNTYAVIYDSAGVASVRGANAAADYAANKRLQVTTTSGRVIANAADTAALGVTAGAATASFSGTTSTSVSFSHTITIGEMPAHHHSDTSGGANDDYTPGSGAGAPPRFNGGNVTGDTGGGTAFELGPTVFAGTCSGTGVSVLQPTIYYNTYVKL